MLKTLFGFGMNCHNLAQQTNNMLNIEQHRDWIIKCILSCNTSEQLGSCRIIISTFSLLMTNSKVDSKIIKEVEDDLFSFMYHMDTKIFVP